MKYFKYFFSLIGEFFGFALKHKAWWIIPTILLLLLIAGFIAAGSTIAPFIYPLF